MTTTTTSTSLSSDIEQKAGGFYHLFQDLRNVKGVVHVGASFGEEIYTYMAAGVKHVLWIEANPPVFASLQSRIAKIPGHVAINAVIADDDKREVQFRVTSNSYSSSILPLHLHRNEYPGIGEVQQLTLVTKTMDTVFTQNPNLEPTNYNLLVLDIQGAELLALKGMKKSLLPTLSYIITEVNWTELYKGCCFIGELDDFLRGHGFVRIRTIQEPGHTYGDALYERIATPSPSSSTTTTPAPSLTAVTLKRLGSRSWEF